MHNENQTCFGIKSDMRRCAELCLWDHYPTSSEHLPEKLEWFAFPNGPIELTSYKRPEPRLTSFVLHTESDDVETCYCVMLTFFARGRKSTCSKYCSALCHENSGEEGTCKNFCIKNCHCEEDVTENHEISTSMFSWFGVALCFISHSPFVSELSSALTDIYECHILESLNIRESNHTLNDNYLQLELNLVHILEPLCFDVPCPIAGYMDVAFSFNCAEYEKAEGCSGGGKCNATNRTITFALHDNNMFRQCAYSMEWCIHHIGERLLLDLLYHALSEHKILLHAHNTSLLTNICECVRTLLYPLQWCSVYIPAVPTLLLDLVEAPVPFILGIATSDLAHIDNLVLNSIVRVDCDSGILYSTSNPSCCFAPELDRWCIAAIKSAKLLKCSQESVLDRRNYSRGVMKCNSESTNACKRNGIIQSIVFDCFLSMLCYLPLCIYNVSSGNIQVNIEMLLEGYCPSSACPFIRALSGTQAFHRMISNIHSPELSFFLKCAMRFRSIFCGEVLQSSSSKAAGGDQVSSSQMFPLEQSKFLLENNETQFDAKSLAKAIHAPFSRHHDVANITRPESVISPIIFPHWAVKNSNGGMDMNIDECVFNVISRYQKLLGCFGEFSPSFAVNKRRATYAAHAKCDSAIGGRNEENCNDAVFPPIRFAISNSTHRKHYRYWKLDEVFKKLKKQYEILGMRSQLSSEVEQGWKKLFRLLSICKVNQKLAQHSRITHTESDGLLSLSSRPLVSPPSPRDLSASKTQQYEHMFGSDDVSRLIFKILMLGNSDSDLEELVAKMQFRNGDAPGEDMGGSLFLHGDSRRRMILSLRGYAMQLTIGHVPIEYYIKWYEEASKMRTTLPQKRLRSLVDLFPVELHSSAFGFLHQLFKILLQSCSKHKDYLTAYGALEISGYYYQVLLSETKFMQGMGKSPIVNCDSGDCVTSYRGILLKGKNTKSQSSPHLLSESCVEGQCETVSNSGTLVQSIRSRICNDPIFSNINLWQIVLNNTLSANEPINTKSCTPLDIYDTLKPVVVHMMECDVSLVTVTKLLEETLSNFDVVDLSEKHKLLDRINMLWQCGRDFIRQASEKIIKTSSDIDREKKILHIRKLLHNIEEQSSVNFLRTEMKPVTRSVKAKTSPQKVDSTLATCEDEDFDTLPSPFPAIGPQISTISNVSMSVFESDNLFATDDEEEESKPNSDRPSLVDLDYQTDTDSPQNVLKKVYFSFAGQPRHESSLGSTYPKQVTSMHSSGVTAVDIAESRYDYVLQSEIIDKGVATSPTLSLSHHLVSGDTEGHVYVTNWSSHSSRNNLLAKQKHKSSILAVKGLPNDYIASASSDGEIKIWNLMPEGHGVTRKSEVHVIKPFSVRRGVAATISSVTFAEPSSFIGGSSWTNSTMPCHDQKLDGCVPSVKNSGDWLFSIGSTIGELKVFHGNTFDPDLACGREIFSINSPDRSSISCMHLEDCLAQKNGGCNGRITGQLIAGSKTRSQPINSLLKYAVHSRIQSLLSTPAPKSGGDDQSDTTGYLFTGSRKGCLSIFDLANQSPSISDSYIFQSPVESSHTSLVSNTVPIPLSGGKNVLSGGYDRLVKFWDIRVSGRNSCCLDLTGAEGAVLHVDVLRENLNRIVSVSSDNIIRLWDIRQLHTEEPYMCIQSGHSDRICDVMQAGGVLLTASRDGTIISWDMSTEQCIESIVCRNSSVFDGCYLEKAKGITCNTVALSCGRLINAPLFGSSSMDDSTSTCNNTAAVMLVTGDYGGVVKVWKGTSKSSKLL